MSFAARDYQTKMEDEVHAAWAAGHRHVLGVAPTGAGKTVIKANILAKTNQPFCGIAHRQELVSQISMSFARTDTYHRIIAPKNVIQFCVEQQMKTIGKSFVHPSAPAGVCGVDTLLRRVEKDHSVKNWINTCRTWDCDESHHLLEDNKWGKVIKHFQNARGLGVTATPLRADRKSLKRGEGGVFDYMVVGPTMRDLINQKYLAEYRIFAPPASISEAELKIGSTGDFTRGSMTVATEKSTIVGDIVDHYLKIAPGKLGITFTVDVKQAEMTAMAFERAGVPARAVSANTPDALRQQFIDQFSRGEIKQLVNVDLFGEGMDVPAVEVVSMGRPTQSYGLYVQQFGRGLRIAPGKNHGILIDHVGNVMRHGLPDTPRHWTLEAPEGRKAALRDPDVMPVTTCEECFRAYEAVTNTCPYCGSVKKPADRSLPKFVDGDLVELDPHVLAQMRGDVMRIDGEPLVPQHLAGTAAELAIKKRWMERQESQRHLRESISMWAGIQKFVHDRQDPEIYRRFYHSFGVDIMSAQSLKTADANKLLQLVRDTMT